MTLYELLGLAKDASTAQIRSAYRRLTKIHHPDKGGDPEKFAELQEAHDVLTDAQRRKVYDETGRTSEVRVPAIKLKRFLHMLFKSVIHAQNQRTGLSDDPVHENIKNKMLASLKRSMGEADQKRLELFHKLQRANQLVSRFKPPSLDADPVGDVLKAERAEVQKQMHEVEDEIEMAKMAETLISSYTYEVDPGKEGPISPGPTAYHSRGNSMYLFGPPPQG